MKLVMLKGLPASGKSTYAAEVCKEQNWKRVNRDLIRTMLHFDVWRGQNEDLTVKMEKTLANTLLMMGLNVIVDDCNLNPKNHTMWQELAKGCGADFSTKTFKTPYQECIKRDAEREKKVGESVIKNMAFQYSQVGVPMKDIVICDIDGTVADTTHRLHFLQGEKKDWKGFFGAMMSDPVREDVRAQLLELKDAGKTIIFVSSRPDTYRAFTLDWLETHGLGFGWALFMRKGGDSRPDTVVKDQIYETYFKDKKVVKVFDDRPSVIRMWRERGLDVVDVGKGVEF